MALNFKPVNNKEGSTLSKLWRDLLDKSGLINSIDYLIDRYVREQEGAASRVKNLKRKTRSSLTKNIVAQDMTWKTFIDLCFNLLKIRVLTITITATFPNNQQISTSVSVKNMGKKGQDDGTENTTNDNTVSKESNESSNK